MSEGVEPSRVGEVPRIVAGSPAALGGEASGDANALLPPVLESVPSLGLLAPRGGPRRGSSLSSVDVPQNDERSRRGSTTLRRLVIDHPEEIPVRYKRTKRPYVKGKRSLTNRIRQLRDEEHELKMYEMLVSRSLQDVGLAQADFDKRVQESTSPEVRQLHGHITDSDWTVDERFLLASSFAKLALWRIDPGSIEWNRTYTRHLFVLAHDRRWRWGVKLSLGIFLVLIWFEAGRTSVAPNSGELGAQPWAWWTQVLEGMAASGLLVDVCVSFGYQRLESLLESRQNYLRAFIAASCFLDYWIALSTYHAFGGSVAYVRWSRPLRLLYLPFADKASYNSVLSILDTLPSLGDLLLLGLVITFIWAIVGVSAFGPADLRSYGGDSSNAFDSFDVAFVSLATLLTGENFPNLMWPALNYEPTSSLFFFSFVLVGTIMILPATVAVVFEYYKRFHGLKVLEEKMLERRCLLMAFALVDEDNSGTISFHEFAKLSRAVHPESSATERSLLYKLLDSDGSASISAQEFVRLSDVLLLAVRANSHELTRRWPFLKWKVARVRKLVENPWFERCVLLLIVLYVVLLVIQVHPSVSHVVSGDGARFEALIDGVFVAVFALEVVVKVVGLSCVGYFADTWNRIDFCIVIVSIVMLVIRGAISSLFDAGVIVAPARSLRVLRVLRTIRTVSIFSHSHKLRTLTRLFVQMRPVILTILGTILMVFYAYMVVGMEAFMGKASYDAEEREACGAFCPTFDSPLNATITLLQLVLASNWGELTYQLEGDGGLFLTWLFLISFVLLTNAVMLPLLSALILEIYSMQTEKMVRRTHESQLATLFPQDALRRENGGVGADRYVVVLSNGVRKMFERYDSDQSGSISALELGKLLADLGERLSTEELKEVLSSLDVDANGQVSFGEFIQWWQRYGLEKCFRRFDVDNSGTINATELGALMAEVSSGVALTPEELDMAVAELDKDGSGEIGFDEYANWFGDFDVRKVFASFDKDNSGLISRLELEHILAHMGFELSRDELKAALHRLDEDMDGGINFEEFLPWWKELQKSKEEKTFMVQHDRGRRWEENLFLRKREDDGLSSMLQDPSDQSGFQRDSGFVRGALLRRIAADAAAGVALTEDYLLTNYQNFDIQDAQRERPSERHTRASNDVLPNGGPGAHGASSPAPTDGANSVSSSDTAPRIPPVTATSSHDTCGGSSGISPAVGKFDSFPNMFNFTKLSPRRRGSQSSNATDRRASNASSEWRGSQDKRGSSANERAGLPGMGSKKSSAEKDGSMSRHLAKGSGSFKRVADACSNGLGLRVRVSPEGFAKADAPDGLPAQPEDAVVRGPNAEGDGGGGAGRGLYVQSLSRGMSRSSMAHGDDAHEANPTASKKA